MFVSLVRSGEQTGKLSEVLKSLTESLKWEDELAAQTKKIMMYPAFVGSIVLLVTFFLMIYLVPQMTGFIRNMGQEIPLQTRVLIAVSDFFVDYWWAMMLAPFAALVRRSSSRPHATPAVALRARPATRLRMPLDRPDPAQDHPVALRLELRHDVRLGHHGARRDPQLRGDRRQPAARECAAHRRPADRRGQEHDRGVPGPRPVSRRS